MSWVDGANLARARRKEVASILSRPGGAFIGTRRALSIAGHNRLSWAVPLLKALATEIEGVLTDTTNDDKEPPSLAALAMRASSEWRGRMEGYGASAAARATKLTLSSACKRPIPAGSVKISQIFNELAARPDPPPGPEDETGNSQRLFHGDSLGIV